MTNTTTFSSHSTPYHHPRGWPEAAIQLCCLLAFILWFSAMGNALPPNPPPGPYHQSCRGSNVVGTDLRATCVDFFGKFRETHLDNYAACTGSFTDANGNKHPRNIFDIDGTLRCVIDLKKRSSNDPHDPGGLFDVISIIQQETRGSQVMTAWRIDRPEVWSTVNTDGEADYPMITFQPGDHLIFAAGGCVQTGGFGPATWKRYLKPTGPNADRFYSGRVSIAGVTGGSFSEISAMIKQGAHIIPTPPVSDPTQPKNILRLGYKDDQSNDNGYYRHDDGTDGQCKNEGPAWVQITVLSGIKLSGPLFSPHSKPFDLVWDMNHDEDENELPMDPQWNFTLEHTPPNSPRGEQPHFIPICGPAFNSPSAAEYTFNPDVFAQICSSMSPDFDEVFRGGAICHGHPIPGHLNFGIATYIGKIEWDSFGDTDNDWSFNLWRSDGAGLAGQDESNAPGDTLHLEFDARELPLGITPFWQDMLVQNLPFPAPNPTLLKTFSTPGGVREGGLEAVAIGEIGLDGVHGAPTELHPLFALAVRVQNFMNPGRPDEMVEKWAFFLRNSGNEGYCSAQQWIWPDRTTYFIPLPWPANATQLLSNSSDVVRWQDPPTPIGIQVNKDQRFSYISVGRPSGVELFGAGGTFELFYKVTGQPKPKKAPTLRTSGTPAPRPAHAHDEAEEIDLKSLSSRIADPAVKAKYEAAVKALPSMTTPRLTKAIHVDVPSTITERTHVPGTASKGIMTRAVAVPNAPKLKWNSEVFQILQTYQKDLKIEPPASPPPANAPVASVPAK